MTQQTHDQYDPEQQESDLSRRDFVAMSLAAGVVAAGVPGVGGHARRRDERRDQDARRHVRRGVHPPDHRHRIPACMIWPDAFGLRPAMREMGKRLAAEGYAVLVPNPFYRVGEGPVLDTADLQLRTTDRAKLHAADGRRSPPPAPPRRTPRRSSRGSTRSRRSTRRRRSARRATAWAVRW